MHIQNNQTEPLKLNFRADDQAFDRMYLEHYTALFHYAFTMLNDDAMSEEVVHDVFLKILDRTEPLIIHTSLKAYLYRSVHNNCLNYFKRQNIKQAHQAHSLQHMNNDTESASGKVHYQELESELRKAINQLPEQCRTVFQLSRFEELKHKEIALELGISVKTVEAQITKALKRLRVQLADYLPAFLWLLINLLS